MSKQFEIEFKPSGRGQAQCAADPAYPDGIHINLTRPGQPRCRIEFPYPAKECGAWLARCRDCGLSYCATAAGRVDDPRSLTVPCSTRLRDN